MSWIGAGVAVGGLVLSAVKHSSGQKKEAEAKKGRANLKTPFYNIQNEYYQNVNQAASLAQGGLPSATKDYYSNKSQQGLTAGITGILSGGGNPNDISKLFKTYDDGISKIASIDAETHINNIKYYREVNKDLAGQKTIQWSINKQQPYLNTLKELSAAQKAGEATKNEATNDAMSSLTSFATSMAGRGDFGRGTGSAGDVGGGEHGSSASAGEAGNRGASAGTIGDSTSPYRKSNTEQAHTSIADPFSNTNDDYAKFQQWLQYQEQGGEKKGGF